MKKLTLAILACTVLACTNTPPETSLSDAALDVAPAARPHVDLLTDDTLLRLHRAPQAVLGVPRASSDTRTASQRADAACTSPAGAWLCPSRRRAPVALASAGTQPINPPAWSVPDWYVDPANVITCAQDSNSGTSATCVGGCSGAVCPSGTGPVLTFAEVIQHRLGTFTPKLAQLTTFHELSPQPAHTDVIDFEPYIAEGGQAALVGTLAVKTANFQAGAVTAKNQATGTRLAVAGFPGGTATGDYVLNTDQNSYAIVDVGGATPVFSQPLAAAGLTTIGLPTFVEDNGWANNQHYTIYARPSTNLKVWHPKGGDQSAGGVPSVSWLQWISIAEASGTPGFSGFSVASGADDFIMSGVQVVPELEVNSTEVSAGGSDFVSTILVNGALSLRGCLSENELFVLSGEALVSGGSLMQGTPTPVSVQSSLLFWGDGYVAGGGNGLVVSPGGVVRISNFDTSNAIWGAGIVEVDLMGSVLLRTGTWVTTALTSGGLGFIDSAAGFTPQVCSAFIANGSTQVNVTPPGSQHWPANAPISFGLESAGGTPGALFFSANQAADAFHVKSTSSTDTSEYNYCTGPGQVFVTPPNLDLYGSLTSITGLAVFGNTP